MFFMPLGAAYFVPQGQRGGRGIKSRGGVAPTLSFNSFVISGFPLLIGFHNDDREKSGKTIATPPKRGFLPAPIAALSNIASIRPQGVAIVGIYPCGKARKRRLTAARSKRRMNLWNCGRTAGN